MDDDNLAEPCKNVGVLKGHKNAILDLQWGNGNERMYSAGSDRQVFVWDTMAEF